MNTVAGVRLWLETKQSTSIRSAVFYMQEHVFVAAAVVQERLCRPLSGWCCVWWTHVLCLLRSFQCSVHDTFPLIAHLSSNTRFLLYWVSIWCHLLTKSKSKKSSHLHCVEVFLATSMTIDHTYPPSLSTVDKHSVVQRLTERITSQGTSCVYSCVKTKALDKIKWNFVIDSLMSNSNLGWCHSSLQE